MIGNNEQMTAQLPPARQERGSRRNRLRRHGVQIHDGCPEVVSHRKQEQPENTTNTAKRPSGFFNPLKWSLFGLSIPLQLYKKALTELVLISD